MLNHWNEMECENRARYGPQKKDCGLFKVHWERAPRAHLRGMLRKILAHDIEVVEVVTVHQLHERCRGAVQQLPNVSFRVSHDSACCIALFAAAAVSLCM